MKFAFIQLEQHGATVDTSNPSQITFRSRSGRPFTIKAPPDPSAFAYDLTEPTKINSASRVAQHALNAFLSLDSAVSLLYKNPSYSDYGRREKLEPVREATIKTLGALNQDVKKIAQDLQGHMAQFYKVPPPAQNDLVGYFREAELRGYLRTLSLAEQIKYVESAAKDNPSILHAVLRSPIPNASLEDYANRLWRQSREMDDPMMAEGFLISKAAAEWSTSILQAAAGLVSRQYASTGPGSTSLLDMQPQELLAIAHPAGAAELFGFGPGEIARYVRLPSQAA